VQLHQNAKFAFNETRNIDWTLATDKPSVSAKSVKFLYRKKGSFIIQEFKR